MHAGQTRGDHASTAARGDVSTGAWCMHAQLHCYCAVTHAMQTDTRRTTPCVSCKHVVDTSACRAAAWRASHTPPPSVHPGPGLILMLHMQLRMSLQAALCCQHMPAARLSAWSPRTCLRQPLGAAPSSCARTPRCPLLRCWLQLQHSWHGWSGQRPAAQRQGSRTGLPCRPQTAGTASARAGCNHRCQVRRCTACLYACCCSAPGLRTGEVVSPLSD